jgi:Putative prokaryotic signal transducing protein
MDDTVYWEPCYSTPMEVQAHLVKGYLEQYGVPCLLENLRFGMKPLSFGALGEVRVLVRSDWSHIARGLLRGRQEAPSRHLRLVSCKNR